MRCVLSSRAAGAAIAASGRETASGMNAAVSLPDVEHRRTMDDAVAAETHLLFLTQWRRNDFNIPGDNFRAKLRESEFICLTPANWCKPINV